MGDKRKRTTNFTQDEKSVLTELVGKYKVLIENKKTDATTNAEKTRAWQRLTQEFNAHSTYCERAPEALKTFWENIKRTSKKELFKTGGGRQPPPPPSSGADRLIGDILGPALEGLENQYDCDALLEDDKDKAATYLNTYEESTESEITQTVVVESEPLCPLAFPLTGTTLQNKV